MSDSPRPGRIAAPVLLILSIALGVTAWLMIRQGTYVLHDIPWTCDSEGCGTNDARVAFLVVGGFLAFGLAGTAWSILHMTGVGIAFALGSFATVSGWRRATAAGLEPAAVNSTAATIWTIAGWLGIAVTALALRYELKVTGTLDRILGRPRVPARLTEFEVVDDAGTALITFTDTEGLTHTRRIPAAQSWLDLPVHAHYHRDDPTRVRLALPWYRPLRGDGASEDDTVADELERVTALYAKGHLSAAEFQRAKSRILEKP
ncbi:SHOCT domain-containing protein [Nocardia sp. NBC_01503]|uniref:SHOCT domain-containing protein n=1 Tax=Nocardia sp. NBC_01503 TaxID=2975997 RepID=UPI002E7C47CC|nr:SHOCT domain-containing protein [Nocardia sp. NBC_01503]WTL32186.1 SHOCT domain-containing protein [Nocardia sp. NBC_01503]